jgi:acetyltransferase-like isoleucine patch superfamily enzyme
MQAVFDMPWRVTNELRRLVSWPYIRLAFQIHGLRWGKGWRIFGMPIIQRHRHSTIVLGDGLELRSWYSANPIAPNHRVVLSTRSAGASLQVGRNCGLTGAVLVATEKVEIGDRVLLGSNCVVTDVDFHPLDPVQRRQGFRGLDSQPVFIDSDVFIGMSCLVLKGVSIGKGSVIGAGSVVAGDVPPGVVAAGNPIRVLRSL